MNWTGGTTGNGRKWDCPREWLAEPWAAEQVPLFLSTNCSTPTSIRWA
jgi:hypothetical protein